MFSKDGKDSVATDAPLSNRDSGEIGFGEERAPYVRMKNTPGQINCFVLMTPLVVVSSDTSSLTRSV